MRVIRDTELRIGKLGAKIAYAIFGVCVGANKHYVLLQRRRGEHQIRFFTVINGFAQGEGRVLRGAALLRHLRLHDLLGGGQYLVHLTAIGKKVKDSPLRSRRNGGGDDHQDAKDNNQTGR